MAGSRPVFALAGNGSAGHDGRPAVLEQILSVRRPPVELGSAVQLERSDPLLLAGARSRNGPEATADEPGLEPAAAHSVEPVLALAIRSHPRRQDRPTRARAGAALH